MKHGRLILIIMCFIFFSFLSWLVMIGVDLNEPYTDCRAMMVSIIQYSMARALLFLWGYYWIEVLPLKFLVKRNVFISHSLVLMN